MIAVGLALVFASPRLATKTPILTYHDFIERRDSGALWFDCTTTEFEDQIRWLRARGARFVSLDQIYDYLKKGTSLPRHAVALTFADGYQGFYDCAWPVLRREKIPATMFVHTGFIGNQSGRPKMPWAELRELQGSGFVTIASQTVTHPSDLRTLSRDQLNWEMKSSRETLESGLGVKQRFLAYPNGKWDARCASAAHAAGYEMAFTEELRPVESAKSLWSVPRYVHTKFKKAWADCYGKG